MPDNDPLSGSLFAAVGEDGLRMFSRDGREWTHRQTGKEGQIYSMVCFGGRRCVTAGRFGGENIFAATRDGAKWEETKADAQYSNYMRSLVYFGDKFIGFISDTKVFYSTSSDGVTWSTKVDVSGTSNGNADNATLRRGAIGNERLVMVGDYGRRVMTRDGRAFENAPGRKPANTLIDVAFGNGVFVGGGMHGLRMRSVDGLEWTDRLVGEEGEHINTMIWDGQRFVGIGLGATYTSPDGLTWERTPNQNAPTAATFGDGIYVGSLYPGRLLRSTDAVKWEEALQVPQHVLGFAFGKLGE